MSVKNAVVRPKSLDLPGRSDFSLAVKSSPPVLMESKGGGYAGAMQRVRSAQNEIARRDFNEQSYQFYMNFLEYRAPGPREYTNVLARLDYMKNAFFSRGLVSAEDRELAATIRARLTHTVDFGTQSQVAKDARKTAVALLQRNFPEGTVPDDPR